MRTSERAREKEREHGRACLHAGLHQAHLRRPARHDEERKGQRALGEQQAQQGGALGAAHCRWTDVRASVAQCNKLQIHQLRAYKLAVSFVVLTVSRVRHALHAGMPGHTGASAFSTALCHSRQSSGLCGSGQASDHVMYIYHMYHDTMYAQFYVNKLHARGLACRLRDPRRRRARAHDSSRTLS